MKAYLYIMVGDSVPYREMELQTPVTYFRVPIRERMVTPPDDAPAAPCRCLEFRLDQERCGELFYLLDRIV
jgi:hypothetical protein